MFEGVVHRVLVGYLGRYVKDFQKDQLKLSLWNEEVLLENVELIPEAFDYLQLPFALKHGRVGRLSIKISWKKLGWDHPIIIALEDVFVCASRRDDQDWSLGAVEKREFAGKKAQLAAAELAKLSRRVCDNQAGKSFLSFITAKVLDCIQVSIRSFHVQYSEMQFDSAQILFGLRFSSLTVKQNPVGSSSGKVVGGQVNKTLDIKGLAIYCGTRKGITDSTSLDDATDYKFWCSQGSDSNLFDHLLHPFDVSVSIVFNRAGKLDGDSPQYSIVAELTALVMCLNEVQLQHILTLSDYLSTSHLREKYGRYRPWGSPLSRKLDGWQKLWWHYAQESVLSDVRKKLKKNSWRYLGQRLNCRRKYTTLYKTKLDLLRQEQSIDETILGELEQIEKECDIEDILSYRSAAELEMQELFSNSSSTNTRVNGGNVSIEKLRNDDRTLGRSRGWLNWLSRGMLGAGGTDDSGQFSGVVSDEVIKDLYEATKFHPLVVSSSDADINDKVYTCAIKCSITQHSLTLESLSLSRKVANLTFKDVVIELKLWEELATVVCFIKSGEIVEALNKKVILQMRRSFLEENEREEEVNSFKVEVEVSPKEDFQLSVKIMLQPLELTCDVDFLLNFMDFCAVLKSFEFQSDRVLLSLNGIKDVKTRLLSKAEYIVSTHRKFRWHISIKEVVIYIPWRNADSEGYKLILELGSLVYTSKFCPDSVSSITEEQSHILQQLPGFHIQELYDYSEVKLNNFQSKLMMPQCPQTITILERFCASLTLVSCIICDESILKQLEVHIVLPLLDARLSLLLLESFVALVEHLQAIRSRSGCVMLKSPRSPKDTSSQSVVPIFGFSVVAKLHSVSLHVDLANDGENSSELLFSLQALYVRYVHNEMEECSVSSKALKIIFSPLKGQNHSHILYSSGHQYSSSSSHQQEFCFSHKCVCTEASFLLHYKARRGVDLISHKLTVDLNDAEIHCFPFIFGLLFGFYNRLLVYAASFARSSSYSLIVGNKIPIKMPGFQFQKFGYSNFFETGSSDYASISLDSYPFFTICNSGSLGSPESSICNSMPDWRRLFNLRDGKPRSLKFGLMEGAKTHHDIALGYKSGTDAALVVESFQDSSFFNVDINLGGIRVHFHDSSCIVGTVALSSCKLSLIICEDSMDLLCSAEGLNLTSSWSTNNLKEFLWGPSLPNLSPLLNVRLRKGNVVSLTPALEVSIGIQHVFCILPSEYLAIIIGYFSLPEWSSYLREQLITDDHKRVASENESQIVYKFEILDSTLIFPVDQDDHRFLKIGLPQLYGSFIHNCAPDNVLKDIPPQIMVPVHKVAKASHCLNIFGRYLYLSFLLHKSDEFGHLMAHQDIEANSIALIEPVSVDVWVRLPCESASPFRSSSVSTCIMSRISTCQLIADDCNTLNGIEALLDVINQFNSVDVESKYFTSDVLHFLQLKRNLKENGAFSPLSFGTFPTEVQCSVDSLAITLCHQRDNATAWEPVAKADMQFVFSATLINETTPISMDFGLSSLTLRSALNSVMLMRCIDSCSVFSALHICFSKSVEGANELHVSLPCLDIWLHMFDWNAVIDLAVNFAKQKAETASVEASSKSSPKDIVDLVGSAAVAVCQTSLDGISMQWVSEEQNSILTVRSEDIGITIHFPISLNKSRIAEFKEGRHQNVSLDSIAAKDCNFVAITVRRQSSKLSMAGGILQMKFTLQNISGSLGICENKRVTNWPFFQISQINLVTESSKSQMELVSVKLAVQCDQLDVWLSHRVFHFWHDISFDVPELASPQSSFSSVDFRIELRKASLLISDERWTCGGPLLEILLGNVLLQTMMTENSIKCSVDSNLDVNYNNIHKVLWEPFVEPWKFQINVIRKQEMTNLLSCCMITDVHLSSTAPLNLNFTESLIECICRTIDMVKDSICSMQPDEPCENQRFLSSQLTENISGGRYAPYVLQNLTSLPLVYHVSEGFVNSDEFEFSQIKDGKFVDPGASVPIFLHKTPEEQLFRQRPAQSSDRLNEKQSNGVVHHFMSIQLDGTSLPSVPISMDRVGLTLFEVDFSKISNKMDVSQEGVSHYEMRIEENIGFVVPVVFDVTMQRYNKLIRVYSTVILSNATSMPLELRFDIPFGVSPKILDPIAPGQKFPLPLHLAEAGRMRWRPHGRSYLWSEVYDLSNIICQETQESKFGFLRSFVCYPSHPSSDPFRCCVSVQNFGLLSSSKPKTGLSLPIDCSLKGLMESADYEPGKLKKKFIHQLTLSTPLVVNSYLPDPVSMTIESGRVTHTVLLSEEGTSFHHVDPSHDVELKLHLHGFRPSSFKFPRTETFGAVAKFNGTKFSQTETMTFNPDSSHGQLYVTMEKTMDAFSGSRELFIFVPFMLYNCTGLPLNIAESAASMRTNYCSIPSSYNLIQQKVIHEKRDGLCLLASKPDSSSTALQIDGLRNSFSNNHIFLSSEDSKSLSGGLINKSYIISGSSKPTYKQSDEHDLVAQGASLNRSTDGQTLRNFDFVDTKHGKVKACMYSTRETSSVTEIMVRVCACLPEHIVENVPNSSWSDPFLLVPPSGSSTVLIPQSSSNAAFIISVTSSTLIGSVAGQTRAITFQPRYVISNACSKDLCYKQKGTDFFHHLDIRQHSHLHWTDTVRELLVSIRFNEPGWQWSGSFSPDHLGDTQVKMWNYVSGALTMIRVEVLNADVSINDEQIVGSLHGNSGTNLILLSDDDTGFMPYRIDNFSKERLRIYQQRCETFDTIVHPYTSCLYAWDEPCYPHRLAVEVPGERVVGLYSLDDPKEYIPVSLKSTSEKPEQTLLLSVLAEGATKVLRIVDSSCHNLSDLKVSSRVPEKRKYEQKPEDFVDYNEKFSFVVPYLGLSLINAYPQELLFACAKNITLDLLQSPDQQMLSFQISSLQVDNQLHITPYPVILSFNQEYNSNTASQRVKDDGLNSTSERLLAHSSESSCKPVVYLVVATWRKKDVLLASFQHVKLRVANFCLELEQEVILSVFDFFKAVSSRFQNKVLAHRDSTQCPPLHNVDFIHAQPYDFIETREDQLDGVNFPASNYTPSVVPIGAPWQLIHLLARRQKKIYVELLDLAPIKFTLSFSSAPWRNRVLTLGESLIPRGLMALADVEGAQIHLKRLTIAHQIASWESMQGILIRHYTRQVFHEMYKVFGSAGIIGNPMGFARSLGLGIRDFLSVPARSILQSPAGLIAGMAQGTTSLVSNTVYALSDAATQFSKAAHKGIVAFAFDEQFVARIEKQQKASHSKGVINEVLEGLTGLLQSPIKGAEKHGLPGVISGMALGVTGLVARPAASILEVTGKTAQSIRNRSRLYQVGFQHYRVRLPRPLRRELPLRPYSLEEAVGTSVLMEVDDGLKLQGELLVMCKSLKPAGKFVVLTERLVLVVSCSSLIDIGKPEFRGIPISPEWMVETEISLDRVINVSSVEGVVHIIATSSDALLSQNQHKLKRSDGAKTKLHNYSSSTFPLFQTNLELASENDAEHLLQVLLSAVEQGKGKCGRKLIHQSNKIWIGW